MGAPPPTEPEPADGVVLTSSADVEPPAAPVVEPVVDEPAPTPTKFTRRSVLGLLGAGSVGIAVGAGATSAITRKQPVVIASRVEEVIRHEYSPHGEHQAGIITPQPAETTLVALTLDRPDTGALVTLLRHMSALASQLMAGTSASGSYVPELVQPNVSLSITVGLGPSIFALPGLKGKKPPGFGKIPAMTRDVLQPRWSGGDVLLIIAGDDHTSVSHACSALIATATGAAKVAWVQRGSWRGTDGAGKTVLGRNMFGYQMGLANPREKDLETAVWLHSPREWYDGGTQLVVRRIEMNGMGFNQLSQSEREALIGRKISDGAPLAGKDPTPDFAATTAEGQPAIAENAHIRVARSAPVPRPMLRRVLNYSHEEYVGAELNHSVGMIMLAFVANIEQQYVPVQKALDANDALNQWTTTIGSATFVIPPGYGKDSYLAHDLFD